MKKLAAEFIGTFALVFCGTGAIIISQESGNVITHGGIAMTFGLIILAMIYSFGEISGAHFNPAVTIGFFIDKRFPLRDVAPYLAAQLSGGFAASGVLKFLFPNNKTLGATIPAGSDMQSFVLEIILTFFLMLVILRVSTGAKEKGITAGIVIGAVVGLEAMFAGPISGASMNPARSLAPAMLCGEMKSLWIYLTAPFIGSVVAVFIHKIFKS